MDAFFEMRRFLASNALMFERISEMEVKQLAFQKNTEDKFDKIFHYISEHEESSQKIFFDGQIYDAFSLLVDLASRAEKKLVLVDNYVDVGTLNILAKKKSDVEVIVYTVRRTRLSEADVVFPEPEAPIMAINSPSLTDKFTLDKAEVTTESLQYSFDIFSSLIISICLLPAFNKF